MSLPLIAHTASLRLFHYPICPPIPTDGPNTASFLCEDGIAEQQYHERRPHLQRSMENGDIARPGVVIKVPADVVGHVPRGADDVEEVGKREEEEDLRECQRLESNQECRQNVPPCRY